jgi:sugar phosphate isomerase/epimerase
MKLSFSTLGCPEWSFADIISVACDMGYDGVEIRGVGHELDGSKILEFQPGRAEATKALLKKKGLEICCLSSACYLNDKNITAQVQRQAEAYADTAGRMGIPYIRVLADYGPEQSGRLDDGYIAEQLKRVAQYAWSGHVDVLVETNGYFADSTRLARLIDKTGEENVGVIWDVHHPYRYFDETPAFTVETLGGFIRHVHVKDARIIDGAPRYMVMGYGDLPVRDCVERLLAIGYDGYFSLEWLRRWDFSLEEPGIAFAAYASYMRDLM